MKSVPFAPLDPALYREIVRRALAEDLGWGDVTTEATVRADQRARGILLVKSRCVIAGIQVAAEAFRQLDPAISFEIKHQDGSLCAAGDVIAELRGSAAAMLTAERTAIGGGGRTRFTDVLDHARAFAANDDPVWRQELTRLYTRYQLLRWLNFRVRTAITRGRAPGPESSVLKLLNSHHVEHLGSIAVGVMGAAGTLGVPDAKDGGFWQGTFLAQWSSRIGGGTEQVQRNIIGERVLGLPKEPR